MVAAEGKDGRRMWHVVGNTERIESRIRKGRVEIDGNIEVFERGRHERVRQDWDEVLCAEGAAISARMD